VSPGVPGGTSGGDSKKDLPLEGRSFFAVLDGQRLVTLPAFRQEVHTLSRFGVPATIARTRWMFGFQRRFVFFFDHGTL
jgi:hypothetical protein